MIGFSKHVCPIPGCPQLVEADKIMCVKHWRMVPGVQQARIWRLHSRAFGNGRSKSVRDKSLRDLADSRRRAIAAVLEKIASEAK